ncbi:hypothetical protein [Pseudarthrobacter sp. AB1]|uniref:hypothetical protein n=1 Tax=Pseudarthrobacter sp. AB1 TaxID=2138309 RepID=UPI00186B8A35|nr:hypothetical protein [Pseudarthrobacter sp. AB1]MBE4716760.1 hypothetical protein [Pseudarthrobacter sp. AB1]
MSRRPYVTAKPYVWKDAAGVATPGIALMQGAKVRAHLTADEARTLADTLHDMADRIDAAESTPKETN